MFERGFYCSTCHSDREPCSCEGEHPFEAAETFDETGRSFFRGILSAVIATACFAATGALVFALIAWCAP